MNRQIIKKLDAVIKKIDLIENNMDGSEQLKKDLAKIFGIDKDFKAELKRLKTEYDKLKNKL